MADKFDGIESLENWVAWQYLNGTLGWPVAKVAYELNVNGEKLLEWVNARASKMTRWADRTDLKAQVNAILDKLKQAHPESVIEPDAMPKLDHDKVAKLFVDETPFEKMGEAVGLSQEVFRKWWSFEDNRPIVNAKISHLMKQTGVLTRR